MDSMYDAHHTALNASVALTQSDTCIPRISWFGVTPYRAYNRAMAELDAFGQES
jgi:hypothetical protein